MKRIIAVLILVGVGVFVCGTPLQPSKAIASDFDIHCLEVPDIKDNLPVELQGQSERDGEGDPDAGGDGLGFDDQDDLLESCGLFDVQQKQILIGFVEYLMRMNWLVP